MSSTNATQKQSITVILVAAALVIVGGLGYRLVNGEPSAAESAKVVCGLRDEASAPLVDSSKSNSREDLSASLRRRAASLESHIGSTSGEVRKALRGYAAAMRSLADAVVADTSGAALSEEVTRLSTDPVLTAAQETLNRILDNQC